MCRNLASSLYLGLPLHFRRLRKVDLQPLIDKIVGKLPGWMGKNLAHPGIVTLAKSVLPQTFTTPVLSPSPNGLVTRLPELQAILFG
jgi:hypothetical protein